jgi:hypothetical protein
MSSKALKSAVILMCVLAFSAFVVPMPTIAEGPDTIPSSGCTRGCYTPTGCAVYAYFCGGYGLYYVNFSFIW